MPSHGRTITKITQSVLPPPPRSLLRKMSPRTQNRHMNHAKNRKNSNRASRNEPLSLNMRQPFKEAETVDPTGLFMQPYAITGRRASPGSDETGESRAKPATSGALVIRSLPGPRLDDVSQMCNFHLVPARQLSASSSADLRRLGPPDSEVPAA